MEDIRQLICKFTADLSEQERIAEVVIGKLF